MTSRYLLRLVKLLLIGRERRLVERMTEFAAFKTAFQIADFAVADLKFIPCGQSLVSSYGVRSSAGTILW